MFKNLIALIILLCFAFSLSSFAEGEEEKKEDAKQEDVKKKKKKKKVKKAKPVIDLTPTLDELHLANKGELILDEVLPLKDKSKYRNKGFVHGSTELIEGGGVIGKTDPKYNGHAANYALNFDHANAIYEFEVKLDDYESLGGIRVGYHMASAYFSLKAASVKNDTKELNLKAGKWHKVIVTRMGRHVSLEVGGITVKGEEPKLTAQIGAIRLSVAPKDRKSKDKLNAKASYRNLKIWKSIKNN